MQKRVILLVFFLLTAFSIFGSENQNTLKLEKTPDILNYSLINVVGKKIEQPLSVIVKGQNNIPVANVAVKFNLITKPSGAKDYAFENEVVYTDNNI